MDGKVNMCELAARRRKPSFSCGLGIYSYLAGGFRGTTHHRVEKNLTQQAFGEKQHRLQHKKRVYAILSQS